MLKPRTPLVSQVLHRSYGKQSSLYIILSFTAQSETLFFVGGGLVSRVRLLIWSRLYIHVYFCIVLYCVMVHSAVQVVL